MAGTHLAGQAGASGSLREPADDDDRRTLFGIVATMLALALVLDQLWWGGFELLSPHAVVVLAALWVVSRPTSVPRFTAMTAAMVASVAIDMPAVGSHRLLALIVGSAVLAGIAWRTVATRRVPEPGAVFAGIAPLLRTSVLVLYVFAALAKLNSSFLDPTTSCAVSMAPQIVWFDPSLVTGRWVAAPAIWGTILVEATLPVLLASRRTRLIGLGVGLAFHTVLALAGNVPYTALVFALYVAFLPLDTARRLRRLGARHPVVRWSTRPSGGRAHLYDVGALSALGGLWLLGARVGTAHPAPGLLGVPSALTSTTLGVGTRAAVVVLAVLGASVLVLARDAPSPRWRPHDLRPRDPIVLGATLILVVNGLCPYLGLKTDTSFEMFSGLRTEPGSWNHLVVPESTRIFDYQDQLVAVLASSDPALVARSPDRPGANRMVRFELERYLRAHPDVVVTVTTPDQPPQDLGPLPAGPTLAERLATFRDVPAPQRTRC